MTVTMSPPSEQPSSSTTVVEITIISAEGLNNYTSYFTPTIKPFITLTKLPATADTATQGDKPGHVVSMPRVDDGGGGGLSPTPTWDHKFRVPVDPGFFSDRYSCLHLQLFTKRRIVGPAQLGWCLIPASDIGLVPPGSVRYLSYRLRARDGSRGHAIINISIRLEGHVNVNVPWMSTSVSPTVDTCQTVIGIPVTAIRGSSNGDCSSTNTSTNSRMMR